MRISKKSFSQTIFQLARIAASHGMKNTKAISQIVVASALPRTVYNTKQTATAFCGEGGFLDSDLKQSVRIALSNPEYVLGSLGLLENSRKNHTGYMICCPWHSENSPSCSVRVHPTDGTLSIHCFGCGEGGDVFRLIAASLGLDPRNNFRDILDYAGRLSGIDLKGSYDPSNKPVRPVFVPTVPVYPPENEVAEIWFNSASPCDIRPAREWFEIKQLSAGALAGYCRVIPKTMELPEWAKSSGEKDGRKWNSDWIKSGHRLLIPMYDSGGKLRSLKARCLDVKSKMKNMMPRGFSSKNLIMADHVAHGLLVNGNPDNDTYNVVFCEGEVDFLVALQTRDSAPANTAVFGVYSGGWSKEHALRLGKNITIFFFTDRDSAGMKYKQDIAKTFLEAHRGV